MIYFPNAKINLGLNIIEKRTDGYHNIETILLPIGFEDILEVIPLKDINRSYKWSNSGLLIDTLPGQNICIKALNILKDNGYDIPPVNIQLHKLIPFGAGLGGGSSDGAHMLKLLNQYFDLHITDTQLQDYAIQLGADCPFFIANRPAFATGIGEILETISVDLSEYVIGLIVPDIHVSTQDAYSNVIPKQPTISITEAIEQPIEHWKDLIFNDFETSVFNKYPEIKEVKNYLYSAGALYASMSGSGSSVFGIFKTPPEIKYKNYRTWICCIK